MYFTIKKVV